MDEAVSIHEKNLEILQTNDRHPKVAQTQQSLASLFVKLSKYEQAERIYKNLLLATESKSRDPRDRSTLEVKHNYAGVLYHLERYEESKQPLLQIQNAVMTLDASEQREMDPLTQSVDRYLAACIEATNDVSLGVSRVVASVLKRTRKPPNSKIYDPNPVNAFPDRPAQAFVDSRETDLVEAFSALRNNETEECIRHDVLDAGDLRKINSPSIQNITEEYSLRTEAESIRNAAPKTPTLAILPVATPEASRAKSDQTMVQEKKMASPDSLVIRLKSAQSTPCKAEMNNTESGPLAANEPTSELTETVGSRPKTPELPVSPVSHSMSANSRSRSDASIPDRNEPNGTPSLNRPANVSIDESVSSQTESITLESPSQQHKSEGTGDDEKKTSY